MHHQYYQGDENKMGLSELRQQLMDKLRQKNAEYNAAQNETANRDDYETTDKGLRNIRRHVRKYVDQDEKAQLQAYLRQRQAQEDSSWMNPYGMLDNQEINISQDRNNSIMNAPNTITTPQALARPIDILGVPRQNNHIQKKTSRRKRK